MVNTNEQQRNAMASLDEWIRRQGVYWAVGDFIPVRRNHSVTNLEKLVTRVIEVTEFTMLGRNAVQRRKDHLKRVFAFGEKMRGEYYPHVHFMMELRDREGPWMPGDDHTIMRTLESTLQREWKKVEGGRAWLEYESPLYHWPRFSLRL